MERVELHLHTNMSQMDGINCITDYINKAKEFGMTSLAITDHGVVQAFPEAQKYLEKIKDNEFKVLYGVEGYFAPNNDVKENTYHISILATNKVGLKNLYKIVSISNLKYFNKRPRILKKILDQNKEGLIIGSACNMGELYKAIIENKTDEELEKIANYYDYLEIQPIENNVIINSKLKDEKALQDINTKIVELGEKLNKLVVATSDVHFLNKEDEIYRRILQAGQVYDDADNQPPLYFRNTEEMLKEFEYLGQDKAYEVVVTNTNKIADVCEKINAISNEKCYPHIAYSEDEIIENTYSKAFKLYEFYDEEKKYCTIPDFIKERLDKELDDIVNNGYASIYMIFYELVQKSKEKGYIVGSRGTVGSSLVAYLLGITEINPLPPHYRCNYCQYSEVGDPKIANGIDLPDKSCPNCGNKLSKDGMNIPFETFAGLYGDIEPDIDLNFSGEIQDTIQKYVREIIEKKDDSLIGTECVKLFPKLYDEMNKKLSKDRSSISTIRDILRLICLIVARTRVIKNLRNIGLKSMLQDNTGSIIITMENANIGVSSTRGQIISELETLGYISIDKPTQIITPTEKGEELYDMIQKIMPSIVYPEHIINWREKTAMTYKAGTVGTIADRTAVGYTEKYFTEREIPINHVEIERLAEGITGIKRTTGHHPRRSYNSS